MSNINWYPGHMAKTKRQIKENLKYVDVVFEVLDARIPFSSKLTENFFDQKKTILIFAKYDLCNQKETNKWLEYYQKQNYHVIGIDLVNDNLKNLLNKTKEIMADKFKQQEKKGMLKRKTRIMVIGAPNVGKSTLINRLVKKKATNVGNRPGVTKNLNWIRVNQEMELLDTPGILQPKIDNQETALNLASFTTIKEEVLPKDEVAFHIINKLIKHYPLVLKERYQVSGEEPLKIIEQIADKRGCLGKNKEINEEKVYQIIINDVKTGKIKNITFDIKEQK